MTLSSSHPAFLYTLPRPPTTSPTTLVTRNDPEVSPDDGRRTIPTLSTVVFSPVGKDGVEVSYVVEVGRPDGGPGDRSPPTVRRSIRKLIKTNTLRSPS